MKEKNNIYVVGLINGNISVSIYERAKNHFDAKKQAERKFFDKYKKNPTFSISRKCNEKECENLSL